MIGRAARWVMGAVIAAAVMFAAWLAWGARRGMLPGPPTPEPPPPSLDPERDEVVADVEAMDRDEVVDEMEGMGF